MRNARFCKKLFVTDKDDRAVYGSAHPFPGNLFLSVRTGRIFHLFKETERHRMMRAEFCRSGNRKQFFFRHADGIHGTHAESTVGQRPRLIHSEDLRTGKR